MAYEIKNPTSYKVIGSIHFGGSDWRYICEPEQWAAEQGATYRWISMYQYPYIVKSGAVNQNPAFRTGLLKLKAGAKRVFHYMGENEQWLLDIMRAQSVKIFEKPLFVGVQELYFSQERDQLPESMQQHLRAELDKEVEQRRKSL